MATGTLKSMKDYTRLNTASFSASSLTEFLNKLADYVSTNGSGVYYGVWENRNYYVGVFESIVSGSCLGIVAYGIGDCEAYIISRTASTGNKSIKKVTTGNLT